jgi:hypothetical protein
LQAKMHPAIRRPSNNKVRRMREEKSISADRHGLRQRNLKEVERLVCLVKMGRKTLKVK